MTDDGNSYNNPPERWFSLFGLVVFRRTDLLAAAAFILSISTAVYQLWGFLRGPQIEIFHPDVVYITFDKYADGSIVTRVVGQVSFTNKGEVGQNGVIRDVTVILNLDTKELQQPWLTFSTVSRDGPELKVEPRTPAHPIVVNGGSAVSQMIAFAPRQKDCIPPQSQNSTASKCDGNVNFISDTAFLEILSKLKTIELRFVTKIFGSSVELKSKCLMQASEPMITVLGANGWYAGDCATS